MEETMPILDSVLDRLAPIVAVVIAVFLYKALRRTLDTVDELQRELLSGLVATKSSDPSTIHHFLAKHGGQRLNLPAPPEPARNKEEDEVKAARTGMTITHGS